MLSVNKPLTLFAFRQMTIMLCILAVALCSGAVYLAGKLSNEVIQNRTELINVTNRNTARGVEENIRMGLTEVDTVLQLIKLDMETHGYVDADHEKLLKKLNKMSAISTIGVFDAEGNLIFSMGPVPDAKDIVHQDCFQSHKQYEFQEIYIGGVFTKQAEETPAIVLSRRINDSKGNFNGIVCANLSKDNLVGVFKKLELGKDNAILLLRRDRTFLARYPHALDTEIKPDYFMNHPVFDGMAKGKLTGEYETKSPADGIERISSYRFMPDYPIIVVAATSKNEALQYVMGLKQRYHIMAGVFALIIITALLIIWLQMRKQIATAVELRQERYLLSATMLAIGEGIIATDHEGKIVFLNKMAQILTGCSEQEAFRQKFTDKINLIQGPNREKINDFISEVLETGESLYLPNDVVLAAGKNKEYCIAGSVSPVIGEHGAATGVVFSFRDVTETRQKMQRYEYLSQHDQLTGLYNRNFLEEILETEMARSDRYQQSLSMIIFDLDHFKQVNDNYGHPIGDKVLKQTAEIAVKHVRKSDITARIGGEEFIVVMPQTSAISAMTVAEKIRSMLEQYEHPLVGKVTASFGVAGRLAGESFQEWYKRTDEALYRAKQGGRNCVVVDAAEQEKPPLALVLLEWQPEWESGHSGIDDQHRELLKQGNKLIQMSLSSVRREWILIQLERVLEHIINHFDYEEQITKQAGYPEYKNHASIHRSLIEQALKLKEDYLQERLKPTAFFSFIVDDIILGHMLKEDVLFFTYVQQGKII